MLADEGSTAGYPPRRRGISRRRAGIFNSPAKLRMLHFLEEAPVTKVGVLEDFLRGSNRTPGED